ncbi:F0F1 ATP synthase subunit alpha [bacterium]|nr:F0F1 ATP synthase subunit alpha [bacterium]
MRAISSSNTIELLSEELLRVAVREDREDEYKVIFRDFLDEITYNPKLSLIWLDKDRESKKRFIGENLSSFPKRFLDFIFKVIELQLEDSLYNIYLRFIELLESNQYLKVRVELPFSISEEKIRELEQYIAEHLGKEVICSIHINDKLINGIKIDIEEEIIDLSVKSQLDTLRESLEGIEIGDSFYDILAKVKEKLSSFSVKPLRLSLGRVESIRDCVVSASGLRNAKYGELVIFPNNIYGMVMNLEENSTGIILLGPSDKVSVGDTIRATGRVLEVPVGESLIGRVIDPLGRPLDGGPPIETDRARKIEALAPTVVEREPVNTPLQTGLKIIDALFPIGRGQRELIIGDKQTGKTAIAIDTILNQKNEGVICIYVAIGQKATSVAEIVKILEERGAMDYTIIVSAFASEPASLLYIAPYAGCAIGEEFMYQGKDVLIIYDDLSKHAKAYREISLLLRRPPGREAYPGDIFYLHSRLLERSAKLNSYLGGGSLTALPIVETQQGDISAYIPTNLISITDGQIYLDASLFHEGIRPAVDVGLSVSRVGGNAQIKAMRQVAGRLRLDLAQFREVEAFAQISTDIDPATRSLLERGSRIREILKQPQYSPMDVIDQVIILFTVTRGYMDEIMLDEIVHFQDELLKYIDRNYKHLKDKIKIEGLTDENTRELTKAIFEFKRTFSSE